MTLEKLSGKKKGNLKPEWKQEKGQILIAQIDSEKKIKLEWKFCE